MGEALVEATSSGLVSRSDLFVVSKVFNHHHHVDGEDRVGDACRASVAALGGEPIDLYLMHWPFSFAGAMLPSEGLRLPDGRPRPEIDIKEEYLQTWAKMVALKEEGLVKDIGVSNFTVEQLGAIMRSTPNHLPAANQVEFHPYLRQSELLDFCKRSGIILMAYSPLGAGAPAQGSSLFEHPTVAKLAQKHHKSPAQILIRWSVQLGCVCIPKSTNPERIGANFDVSSWVLASEDMAALDQLDMGHRFTRGFMEGQWFDKGELRYDDVQQRSRI